MDGNRRWARAQGLSTIEGHTAGARKISEVAAWAQEAGVAELILYTFSTENWNRAPEEVSGLMQLAERFFSKELEQIETLGVRIRFVGDMSKVSSSLLSVMRTAEERTRSGTKGTITFAFSYGGRAEILSAVNTLLQEGREEVSEEDFSNVLWTRGLEDPDLVIRTGGDHRLSNFLPWQTVYSELVFLDTLWPDLSKEEFSRVLETFQTKERRHGK